MEIIDLDEQNRIIIKDNVLYIQRRFFKQDFPWRDFKYFLFTWILVWIMLALIFTFSWEYVASFVFITVILFSIIAYYFQTEELEIDFNKSVIKHRYVGFERNFKEKVLLNQIEFVQFKLLPGEVLTTNENIERTFELVGRKHHSPHVDLFYFFKKETALKLIPIFKDKLGIEVIDDLENFQYLK